MKHALQIKQKVRRRWRAPRSVVDLLESTVDAALWPLPTQEMLVLK
jgi:glutamine synthetase type III